MTAHMKVNAKCVRFAPLMFNPLEQNIEKKQRTNNRINTCHLCNHLYMQLEANLLWSMELEFEQHVIFESVKKR
jgi:hypothetical protein